MSHSYQGQTLEYAKPQKMMNEVERHLTSFRPAAEIPCPHPRREAAHRGLGLHTVAQVSRLECKVHTREDVGVNKEKYALVQLGT